MLRRYVVCSVMLLMFVGYTSAQSRRSRLRTTPNQPHQVSVTQQLVEQMMRDNAVDRECVESANGRLGDLFSVSAIDLNRDGRPELNLIGTGCACRGMRRCMWWIYRQTTNGYEQLLDGVPAEDISPLRTSTNGYRDIRVSMWAGANDMVSIAHRFDGSRYRDDYVPPHSPVMPRGQRRARGSNSAGETQNLAGTISAQHIQPQHIEVLQNWFVSNPGWRPATEKDHPSSATREGRQYLEEQRQGENHHPYYVASDFNRDGRQDFAVILTRGSGRRQKFAVAIFNGLFDGNQRVKPAFFSGQADAYVWLFWVNDDNLGNRFYVGPPASDSGYIIRPRGKTYVIE